MKKVVIVKNAYYTSEAYAHQVGRTEEELLRLKVGVSVYENKFPVEAGQRFDAACAVFFDKDLNLASVMERGGLRTYNTAAAIEATEDKNKTAVILRAHNIDTPKTYMAPLQYYYKRDDAYLKAVGERLGYPLVVKEASSSLGLGVYLAKDFNELCSIDEKIGNKAKLYQEFVAPEGRSIRAIVIGGKVAGAMELCNPKDFRSNSYLGGVSKAVTLTKDYIAAAEKTAKALKIDFCGIDFFVSSPKVIEVNGNAFFMDIEKATGANIARAFAEYIISGK